MFRAPYPAHLRAFIYIADNVPGSIEQKAKMLNITPTTLRKYRNANQAPRSVHLALFWKSTWGIGYIAGLRTSTYFAYAQSLEHQNKRLIAQIAKLEAELARCDTGPANLPIFKIG